ncbi:MAG: hypothetical protein GXO35_05010 [Gammaproteobacteria bacterium]|nr:hypothetical protein [Gammaproteobacteria bacterium]
MKKQDYLSVETEADLISYCQGIRQNPDITWIAIDTEFVRVDTFFSELSLVQIQDCLGQTALIDPLLISDSVFAENDTPRSAHPLAALIDLLTDKETLKVFHSARQDIEVLYQLDHQMPVSIFDTQLAALFLKHGEMAGFARVVKAELGVTIEKSQTRTNWHHRPLTEAQIEYALDDVRYLAPLYLTCLQQLTEAELNAVSEDCLSLLDSSLYTPAPEMAGEKVKGIKALKPKQLAIVNQLASWRESHAITENKPKKWVMDDEVIVQMAKRPPETVQALYKVPHIKSSSIKAHGEAWIDCIDTVFAMTPKQWPKPADKPLKPTPQEEVFVQLGLAFALQVSIDYHLNLPSITSRHDMLCLIREQATLKPLLRGWRYQLVGQPVQQFLSGQKRLETDCYPPALVMRPQTV